MHTAPEQTSTAIDSLTLSQHQATMHWSYKYDCMIIIELANGTLQVLKDYIYQCLPQSTNTCVTISGMESPFCFASTPKVMEAFLGMTWCAFCAQPSEICLCMYIGHAACSDAHHIFWMGLACAPTSCAQRCALTAAACTRLGACNNAFLWLMRLAIILMNPYV